MLCNIKRQSIYWVHVINYWVNENIIFKKIISINWLFSNFFEHKLLFKFKLKHLNFIMISIFIILIHNWCNPYNFDLVLLDHDFLRLTSFVNIHQTYNFKYYIILDFWTINISLFSLIINKLLKLFSVQYTPIVYVIQWTLFQSIELALYIVWKYT